MTKGPATPVRPIVAAKLRVPRVAGFTRERLLEGFQSLLDHRLAIVTAPAGYGKTTLLVHVATAAGADLAWYRAERGEADATAVLRHLEGAIRSVAPDVPGGWDTVEGAAAALDTLDRTDPLLLLVDDLHELEGTEAEATIARLLDYLPSWVTLLIATRRPPSFDLSRLRLNGELLEIGPDDLRFRSWEAEDLFRDFYDEPLPPEDIAALTRRTEGWAAGLQLFHLATSGQPLASRRRVVDELSHRSKLVREYLAHNVLRGVPEDLRRFLIETSVLGRLDAATCDALRGGDDSAGILQDLERRSLFTIALEDGTGWRYHEVLRSHLESILLSEVGEAEVRARFQLAGRVLEQAGAVREALYAYSRAEDGSAATRLLNRNGERLADDSGAWLTYLPQPVLDNDPWLMLASARRALAAGRWEDARTSYRAAEEASTSQRHAEMCRRERQRLAAWLEPGPVVVRDWMGQLRLATIRDPVATARATARSASIAGSIATAVARLLAGQVRLAATAADEVLEDPAAEPAVLATARFVHALSGCDDRTPGHARELVRCAEAFDELGIEWAARMARASTALVEAEGIAAARRTREDAEQHGDPWGAMLAGLFEAFGGLAHGHPERDSFDAVTTHARALGTGVIESWARAGAALVDALDDHPEAAASASSAESFARSAGTPGAQLIAHVALARALPDRTQDHLAVARSMARDLGWSEQPFRARDDVPTATSARADGDEPAARPAAPGIDIRLLGGCEMHVGGVEVDLASLRPRARAALQYLALHVNRPLHVETLIDTLWPDADAKKGKRNLQVTLSSLRKILEATGVDGLTVSRDGEAYRFEVPDGVTTDVQRFERAAERGRRGDDADVRAALTDALGAYTGELLPEAGPAEWAVRDRERLATVFGDVAARLAELQLAVGDAAAATATCERGLAVDRYRDGLWRTAIEAAEQADEAAAAVRLREQYQAVLAELGLDEAG